jgi:GxxExxY protein
LTALKLPRPTLNLGGIRVSYRGWLNLPPGMSCAPSPDMPFNDPQTFAMIGAAFEVHSELGPGFLEPVYAAAFAIELQRRRVPFRREVKLPVWYKAELLPLHYRVDFVCFDEVIAEVKALKRLGEIEEAQAINYLRASGLQRALLLNFGSLSLQHRRVVVGLPASADPCARQDP